MKKLPIGIQTLSEIIDGGYLYVDKTSQIHRLITSGKYYFLSRPRRFGKSLTLSTIRAIYEGQKKLFKGLWIEDQWDWSKTNTVVHIQFNSIGYLENGLDYALYSMLRQQAELHGIKLQEKGHGQQLEELLRKLMAQTGRKVVLLIDEYDKPLIDYLEKDQLPTAYEHQRLLRSFYGIIKSADPYIEFLMITGVSKFSKVSIFSDLNHLDDITLDKNFDDIVGYTQQDIEAYFEDWIALALSDGVSPDRETLLSEIKKWYNGYSWGGKHSLYNPFSILNFFKKQSFEDYWFKTGTPSFLIKKLKEAQYFVINDLRLGRPAFESYSLDDLDLRALLFQTGYLTLKDIDRATGIYTLGYPNREVEEAMESHLIGALLHRSPTVSISPVIQLRDAFTGGDMSRVIEIINSMLKDVPSLLFQDSGERFYHALVHLHFRYLGLFMQSEVHTSDGRMDAVVQTPGRVYILEFKIDQSADVALQQIRDKRYADRFRSDGRQVVGVGINFETGKRSVGGWVEEIL